GLLLLVPLGFWPFHYALNIYHPALAYDVCRWSTEARTTLAERGELTPGLAADLDVITRELEGKASLADVDENKRWQVRQAMFSFRKHAAEARLSPATREAIRPHLRPARDSIESAPLLGGVRVAASGGGRAEHGTK